MMASKNDEQRSESEEFGDEYFRETESRMTYYKILASVFGIEAGKETLETLKTFVVSVSKNEAISENEKQLAQDLGELLTNINDDLVVSIRTEFAELFIGPRHKLAAPFESVYRSATKRLYGNVTHQVRATYKANGFEVKEKNKVPDDFMAYELEYIANLCKQDIDKDRTSIDCLKAELAFLDDHLIQWAPDFTEAIISSGASGYYSAWARFLLEFLKGDIAFIKAKLGQ